MALLLETEDYQNDEDEKCRGKTLFQTPKSTSCLTH